MKYLNNIIVLLLLAVGLFSCKQKSLERVQLIGEAQGTYYSIIYYDDEARDFKTEIDSLLDAFDQSVSVYQPNSIISRVNRNDDLVVLDDWFIGNFQLSKAKGFNIVFQFHSVRVCIFYRVSSNS